MEDDSNYCWLCTVRADQFIAFMARYAFCLSFLHAESAKKSYFHKHFEVFFFIADSYTCVKSFIQVSV